MKKMSIYFCIVFSMLIISAQSYADEKIAFYNLRIVLQQSEHGKKAAQEFNKFYDEKKATIKNSENDLKERKKVLDENRSFSPSVRFEELNSDYQKRLKDHQELINSANKELKKRDEEIATKMIPQIVMVVKRMKERDKYTDLVDTATKRGIDNKPWPPHILYSKDNDITDKIIAEYNQYMKMNTASETINSTSR